MFGRSDNALTIGRIAGAPVRVGPGAAVIAAFFGLQLGAAWLDQSTPVIAWSIAALTGLGFMASILVHEAAHALVARRRGIGVTEIRLWLLGGSAALSRNSPEPRSEILVAGAGPLATLLLGGGLIGTAFGVNSAFGPSASSVLGVAVEASLWLGFINLVLGVFNLLPALPLDGGRVLTGMLWSRSGDRLRALRTVVKVSKLLAYVGFAIAGAQLFFTGSFTAIWTAFVASMFLRGGDADVAAAELSAKVSGRRVFDVARSRPPVVSQDLNTASARAMLPQPGEWRWAIVTDDSGVARGLVDLVTLQRVADADGTEPVHGVMIPIDHHRAAYGDESLSDALDRGMRPPFVVIDQAWRPVGMVDAIAVAPSPATSPQPRSA